MLIIILYICYAPTELELWIRTYLQLPFGRFQELLSLYKGSKRVHEPAKISRQYMPEPMMNCHIQLLTRHITTFIDLFHALCLQV